MRVLSKQDVVLYINEEKVSKCDTNGQCDTNSKDNVGPMLKLLTHRTHSVFELLIFLFPIYSFSLAHLQLLAIVEFHPSGLPKGWVKELVFRKTKDGLIRRDPVNNMVHEFSSFDKRA